MNTSQILLGGVYETEGVIDPVRVVAIDDHVVMYDVWWPHKTNWSMSTLAGNFAYFRMPRSLFASHSTFLRADTLTSLELAALHPELPFSFAQIPELSWYEPWEEAGITAPELPSLFEAPAIYLIPFGPRNSQKPAVLLHASNGSCFTAADLLQQAKTVQEPFLGQVRLTRGVGLHRSGIKKRIPSYYTWAALSRLDSPIQNAASQVSHAK